MSVGTVVLVPGGFMGPWIWRDVVARLRDAGVQISAPGLTSVADADGRVHGGLAEDAEAVRTALAQAEPPVVLCGHSSGARSSPRRRPGPTRR